MILIEILFKENWWLKNELAKNLWISNSSINITLKNKEKIRIGTKIKWTTWINEILNTYYKWNDLFFEIKEENE